MAYNRQMKQGLTSRSLIIRILDSGDGTPETGVTSATSGLDIDYVRAGGSVQSITITDLGSVNAAWSSGGMIHLFGGYYRLDIPDAAITGSPDWVLVGGVITGMVVVGVHLDMIANSSSDVYARIGSNGSALTALPWNAAWDAEVQSEANDALVANNLDHLLLVAVTDTDVIDDSVIAQLTTASGDFTDYDPAASSLGALSSDYIEPAHVGTAQSATNAGATTVIELAAGASATDDIYNDMLLVIISGTGAGQASRISDYDGGDKDATLRKKLPVEPDNTSSIIILFDDDGSAASGALDAAGVRAAVGLASANLDTQLSTIDTEVGVIDGIVDEILTDTGTTLPATLTTIDSEVGVIDGLVDTLITELTGARAEPTSVPAANATLGAKIDHIFVKERGRKTQTSSTQTVFQDDSTTVYLEASVSDNGTTFTKGKDTTA